MGLDADLGNEMSLCLAEKWAYRRQHVAALGLGPEGLCNSHSLSGGVAKLQEASLQLLGASLIITEGGSVWKAARPEPRRGERLVSKSSTWMQPCLKLIT